MFSSMIQNLLSSGGQAQAMQRYDTLNRYVDNFNKQIKAQKGHEKKRKILGCFAIVFRVVTRHNKVTKCARLVNKVQRKGYLSTF